MCLKLYSRYLPLGGWLVVVETVPKSSSLLSVNKESREQFLPSYRKLTLQRHSGCVLEKHDSYCSNVSFDIPEYGLITWYFNPKVDTLCLRLPFYLETPDFEDSLDSLVSSISLESIRV